MIALFGGSFDPFHKGHYNLIIEAKKQLGLKKIIIIPTGINPWKTEETTDAFHRLTMIKEATETLEYVEVSDYEIKRNELNYTIDTIKHYKKNYPSEKIYYIIGYDQVEKFHDWKSSKEISELVQLVTFKRIGYQYSENLKLFNMIELSIDAVDYASSKIKSGQLDGLMECTLSYIVDNALYLETMLQNFMSTKRLEHTLSVAKLAVEIAVNNTIDPHYAYLAAIFHDIAKELSLEQTTSLMNQYYKQYMDLPKQVWHQYISAYIAKTVFKINTPEILNAIENHTTGSLNMDKLSMCLYVADKYEPLRDFDSSKEISICIRDVEEGFKQCLIDTLEYTQSKGIIVAESFYEIYKKYVIGE